MRWRLAIFLVAMLAACGGRPPAAPAPALSGDFKASSNTARGITGDIFIARAGLTFANGVVLYTRTLSARTGGDLIARNGDSYAAAALGPGALRVELRHVNEQYVPEGVVGLCGAERPQYVALAYEERATSVTLLVFAGEEPPGPEALRTRVCASFRYHAPNGARTREGVVL
ncbi:MAG: hypothetical protein R3C25_10830 [Hyphomonadaceae bacterium]